VNNPYSTNLCHSKKRISLGQIHEFMKMRYFEPMCFIITGGGKQYVSRLLIRRPVRGVRQKVIMLEEKFLLRIGKKLDGCCCNDGIDEEIDLVIFVRSPRLPQLAL
jgi:hypothetical protein